MDTTDPPHQDSAVHTISDNTKAQPHLLLKASDSQSKYVRSLEERLAELERKFEELDRKKTKAPSEAGLSDTSRDSHAADEDEKEGKEENSTWVIIPKARKLNYINFVNRFPIQTEIPVVEALMINTTVEAAENEDKHWVPEKAVEDPEKRLRDMLEKNPYKPDAWMARIRINSTPLVEEVMKVLDTSEKFSKSVTFIHPFDPLVHSYDKLKTRLHGMQEALATPQDESKATGDAEAGDKAGTTEETNLAKIEPTELVSLIEIFVQFLEDEVLSLPVKNDTKIRFASLSSIFKLGDTLFMPSADKGFRPNPDALIRRSDQRLWRVYRIKRYWKDDDRSLLIKAYSIDYDGENYICKKKKFELYPYDGEQEISSLPVFPLKYLENAEQIRVETRAQGKKFVEYQQGLVSHQGWGADLETGNGSQLQYVTGDVVVDMAEATSTHSECVQDWEFPKYVPNDRGADTYTVWVWKIVKGEYELDSSPLGEMRYWMNEYSRLQKITYCSETDPFLSHRLKNKDKKYQLQEQDFELLPRRVFGYVLQKRKFLALDIRNLEPIKDNEMYNSKLIIDPHHRIMLHGLIDSHFQKKDLRERHGTLNIDQDFIANKGRGLIFLLYGVPGVGKTSTAEQIAHFWKKPLLPVTCGNLGTESNEVEGKLKEIFRLGKKWDCILLMDEADVFLSERTPMALERNALVSVFLRELEYFDGVLFLTTNLPGGIDEAFKSRIHITLYYPHLNEEDTKAIWKVNMERLKSIEAQRAHLNNESPLRINERAIRKFAKKHFRNNADGKGRWNGRQIRNAFLIASALAQFEKANPDRDAVPTTYNSKLDDPSFDLNPRHFDIVAKASLGFEEYLAEAKGRLASEIMFQRGQRADFIRSSSEQTAGPSSLTTHVYHPQPQESHEPDPFRQQKGWSEGPTGPYSHQNPVEDQNWTHPAGNPYGGHQGHGAPIHQGRLFQTPQQDPRMRSTLNLGGSVQSRRDIASQGSPSPFQQNHQTNYPSGKMNMSAHQDSDSDSDA